MKYIINRKITEEKPVLEAISCNKCGITFVKGSFLWNSRINEIKINFKYGSKYDSQSWTFDICEDCLLEFVKTFKIAPDGFMQSGIVYKNPQKIFDNWKKTGIWDESFVYTDETYKK